MTPKKNIAHHRTYSLNTWDNSPKITLIQYGSTTESFGNISQQIKAMKDSDRFKCRMGEED